MKSCRVVKYFFVSIYLFLGIVAHGQSREIFNELRRNMVRTQIEARGISDSTVLKAMLQVPRHEFVPVQFIDFAYTDQPLPIGHNQTISQPYIVAYMTEILRAERGEKALEIGTGSGYQAAVLAETGAEVYSIEIVAPLAENTKKVIEKLGYKNIHLKTGDGYQGWPEHAPFDIIIVTCSPSSIPEALQNQLAEGGRMIIPVGKRNAIQYLYYLEKKNGKIRKKNVMPVRFVPMIDEEHKPY